MHPGNPWVVVAGKGLQRSILSVRRSVSRMNLRNIHNE
jgi:hypothetical protein